MHYSLSNILLLLMFITIVHGGVISNFLANFGRRKVDIPGLCPFIRQLEPQDFLRHRSTSIDGRSLDEDLVPDDSNRVANSGGSNQQMNEKFELTSKYDSNEDFREELKDSLCGTVCNNDKECGEGKKCCPTTCGYACYDPVYMIDDVLNNSYP